jgi:hypothetical protein
MFRMSFRNFSLLTAITFSLFPVFSANAGKLLFNPREAVAQKFIRGQSTTLVIADDVNVRNLATRQGNGGFVFATLSKGDRIYVISCEGVSEGVSWVRIYIPDLKEFGYVAEQFLQNNYNQICRR